MKTFHIYITDLFCGELNYSSLTKFKVTANTERGAVCKVSKYTCLNFRKYDSDLYHSTTKLSGLVIESEDFLSYDYEGAIEI